MRKAPARDRGLWFARSCRENLLAQRAFEFEWTREGTARSMDDGAVALEGAVMHPALPAIGQENVAEIVAAGVDPRPRPPGDLAHPVCVAARGNPQAFLTRQGRATSAARTQVFRDRRRSQ